MTAPDRSAEPADDLRDRIAASVRHHIDHEIIAEWICCDPVNPSHHLCWWGEGVRQTMRSLLADDDDEYPSKAIDGITADLQPSLPPASPTAGSNDLRQQLADALNTATWGDPISYAAHRDHGFYGKCGICTDDLPAIAQVCAAVVQPVLDSKDAEIKRLHVEVSRFRRAWEDAMADGDQQAVQRLSLRNQLNQERQRAETAEAVANNIGAKAGLLRLDLAAAIKRAEDAEAERRDWQMAAADRRPAVRRARRWRTVALWCALILAVAAWLVIGHHTMQTPQIGDLP